MGKKEKLIERLKSKPKDFTFEEMQTLLEYLDYERSDKGRTSGSAVAFVANGRTPIMLHKPHPRNELKMYQIKDIIDKLTKEGLI